MLSRVGNGWMVAVVLVLMGCQEEEEVYAQEPGDANGAALALAVEGKVFAFVPEESASEKEEEAGGRPTPEPSPTPAVPDQVTVAIFSNCRNGEACLSYGVYEPDTGRKEFVTATCALNAIPEGYAGGCYTFSGFEWESFCQSKIDTTASDVVVKIQFPYQDWITFTEAPYALSGNSDCVELENAPSPPPNMEER